MVATSVLSDFDRIGRAFGLDAPLGVGYPSNGSTLAIHSEPGNMSTIAAGVNLAAL
jgi:hypothetical protein